MLCISTVTSTCPPLASCSELACSFTSRKACQYFYNFELTTLAYWAKSLHFSYVFHLVYQPCMVGSTKIPRIEFLWLRRIKSSIRISRACTYLSHVPHDSIFLCVNEALQHDSDGHVDIITVHILSQVHSGMGFSYTDYRLNMTHSDRDTTSSLQRNTLSITQQRRI